MQLTEFKGSFTEIGRQYGRIMRDKIKQNLQILVWRKGYEPLPLSDQDFIKWINDQEKLIEKHWPWLLEEMNGVAHGAGVEYRDILMLNLRVWQYKIYHIQGLGNTCSHMVVTLENGKVALAGAMDDCPAYYCGCLKIQPDNMRSIFAFPISGTSWATTGSNSNGLTLGHSHQSLIGLKHNEICISQDIAYRVILQTCSNVEDVKEFCREFSFNANLSALDSEGKVFCCHNTVAGLYEVADKAPCALTNHITDDRLIYELSRMGVTEFGQDHYSRERLGKMLEFIDRKNGKTSPEEIKQLLADKDNNAASTLCPDGNYYLYYACPQENKNRLYLVQPRVLGHEEWEGYEL